MLNSKTQQIVESYKDFQSRISDVDETDLQWKSVFYICQKLPKNAKILDVGCGDGKYIRALQKYGYYQVTGVDLFDHISDKNIKFISADFNQLPLENESFDFIYSISAINYSEDYKKTISEWIRVIKSDGYLLITGHTKYSVFTLIRWIKKIFLLGKYPHLKNIVFHNPNHLAEYSKKLGLKILERKGFFIYWIGRLMNFSIISQVLEKLPGCLLFRFGYHFVLVLKKIKH